MARKHGNEIAVGITVMVVLALAIYIIVQLADFSKFTTDYQQITFKLPYESGLGGLTDGSPVHLGGYKIGQVIATEISTPAASAPDNIDVMFTIEIPSHYHLHSDCILTPEMSLLGGKAILNIDNLGSSPDYLNDGDIKQITFGEGPLSALKTELDINNPDSILSSVKSELDRNNEKSLLGALAKSARNLNSITEKLNDEISADSGADGNLMAEMKSAVTNLNEITDLIKSQLDKQNSDALLAYLNSAVQKFDDSMGSLKSLVNDNKQDLGDAVKSLKNTAKNIEDQLPGIIDNLAIVVNKTSDRLDSAKTILANLDSASESAKDILAANHDKIDAMVDNITEVSINLKQVSRDVRRAPWRLLYKPNEKEMAIQSTVDSAAAFAAGAERLDNAAETLKKTLAQIGQGVSNGGDKISNVLAELENSFDQFKKAEEKFWNDLDEE